MDKLKLVGLSIWRWFKGLNWMVQVICMLSMVQLNLKRASFQD